MSAQDKKLSPHLKRVIADEVTRAVQKITIHNVSTGSAVSGNLPNLDLKSELSLSKALVDWWDKQRETLSEFEKKYLTLTRYTLVAVAFYALITFLQCGVTVWALRAALRANEMLLESTIASFTDKEILLTPVEVDKPIIAGLSFTNVGRAEAAVGVQMDTKRWRGMPDGEMPLPAVTQTPNVVSPGETPNPITIADLKPVDQQFLDGMPTFSEAMKTKEQTSKETDYFLIRLAYSSLGQNHEDDHCFFIVKADDLSRELNVSEAQPGFIVLNCPKWGKHI